MEMGRLHEWRYIRAKERLINDETVSTSTPCKSLTQHSLKHHCMTLLLNSKNEADSDPVHLGVAGVLRHSLAHSHCPG